MAKWTFEPGHTEVVFRARHMMVSYVEGLFKDVHGHLEWNPEQPKMGNCEVLIDARKLWTGVHERDEHLKSADFFDVEHHPEITFKSTALRVLSANEIELTGDLSMRGVSKQVSIAVLVIGTWNTKYWESKGEEWRDFGPVRRIGFTGSLTVNRHDWGVSWQDELEGGGLVVSNEISLRIDVEALSDEDVARAEMEVAAWRAPAEAIGSGSP